MKKLLTLLLCCFSPLFAQEITPAETALLRASMLAAESLFEEAHASTENVLSAGAGGSKQDIRSELALSAARAGAAQSSVAAWGWAYLQARATSVDAGELDYQFPGGTISPEEHEQILAGFLETNDRAMASYSALASSLSVFDSSPAEAIALFKDARRALEEAQEKADQLGWVLWDSIRFDKTVDPPQLDWPTLEDVPSGASPAQWAIQQAIERGPESDGVYRARLPRGEMRGVGFATGWAGPPTVDPRPLKNALLEVHGHPGGGTVILPQMSGDKPAQGWGVSWSIHGVPGWAGRIHHYNLEIRASGANAIEIGQFCPTPASAPVEEVRFFDCQFVETEGVRCVRPISANYCGLGFYDCVWRFGKFTSKEHGVYTRNAFWLELVDCVMLHLGGQDVQSVHRTQEQVGSGLRDCYNHPDIHTKGYLLIDRCVFVRPAIHDERAGSGITIAGSGWDWTIRDTVVIDDGLGKNHAVGGGETYGGMAVWSGGSHKTHPRPSGRFNGKGVIDGLAIWMRSPNRAPLSLQNAEGVDVRRVAVFCGPQMRTVDVLKEAGEVVWQGSEYPEGRNRLLEVAEEYGLSLDPEDMQIPGLRLDGKQQGSSKGQYLLN